MLRRRSIPLFTALLALILCLAARAAEHSPWLEIHSTHFTVITDAGENRGREIALRFEQMRTTFANLLSRDRLNQSIPLTILALTNDRDYYQVAPLRNGQPIPFPGFFLRGADQDFIILNLSQSDAWRAVSHDFALMLLSYNYPPAQPWFDTGLADYFSSIRIDSKNVELGGIPEPDSIAQPTTLSGTSFTEVLSKKNWIPLTDLFAAKAADAQKNPTLYEAQSWMVMHYLIHENKLPETGAYLGLALLKNVPVDQAIQQAYNVSAAQLEQAVKDYFHTYPTSASTTPGAATPTQITRSPVPVQAGDSAIIASPMSVADEQALYAGVQMRIPERRDRGLATLHQLATTPTAADKKAEPKRPSTRVGEDAQELPANSIGSPIAHRLLAWDYIQHGQYSEAFAELGDAASLNPSDMWIRFYLCVAKYRMAEAKHADINGLANMLLDLRSVLEWNPEMAEAYDLLAMGRNAGGTTTNAMQAERAAITLSPRNELYSYHLAQIYVASKKWDAATALLQRLETSSDPQIAAQSRELLSQAGEEKKYGIALTTNGEPGKPRFEAQKSPFDVLDQDQAKREEAEKATDTEINGDKRVTKFVHGRLVSVDCTKAPAALVTIHSSSGDLKLRAPDYKSLLLIGADGFSCDWHDLQVTANYKPGGSVDGDLVSLEMR